MQTAEAIQFRCGHCGAEYRAGAEKIGLAGAKFTCRSCGAAILIEQPPGPPGSGVRPPSDRAETKVYPQSDLAVRLMEERAAVQAERLQGKPGERKEWFLGIEGKPHGPVAFVDLEARAAAGTLSAGMLVWRPEMAHWRPAAEVEALVPLVAKSIVGPAEVEEEAAAALPAAPAPEPPVPAAPPGPAPTDLAQIVVAPPSPSPARPPVGEEPKIALSETMAEEVARLAGSPPPPLPPSAPEPEAAAAAAVQEWVRVEREARARARASAKERPPVRVRTALRADARAPNVTLWAAAGLGMVLVSGLAVWFAYRPAPPPAAEGAAEPELSALVPLEVAKEARIRAALSAGAVDRCLREQRERTAGRGGGLRILWRVRPDGTPHAIQAATASARGTSLASCLAAVIGEARFPEQAGGELALDFEW